MVLFLKSIYIFALFIYPIKFYNDRHKTNFNKKGEEYR